MGLAGSHGPNHANRMTSYTKELAIGDGSSVRERPSPCGGGRRWLEELASGCPLGRDERALAERRPHIGEGELL